MILDSHTGLVLEGGGMRGVFTAGALDFLMDKKIYFPYTIGVSAGACNRAFLRIPSTRTGPRRVILICWTSIIISGSVIFLRSGVSWILILFLMISPPGLFRTIMIRTLLPRSVS